jgi:pimeloyl-ACP methyl ester carboxylesterase
MDDAYLWGHPVRHLADVAHPVVADITTEETVEAMAQSVLERAPASFALAGFSLGGYVSLAIVRRAPERVRKLALLCTSARPDTDARREERRAHMARAKDPRGLERLVREDIAFVIHPDRAAETALVDSIVAMALRQGPEVYARQNRACMERPDSRPSLHAIRCPTLVISGREDRVLPPELSEEIARGIGPARHVPIEESGHYVPLERPHAVTALLREWLLYA